MSSALSPCSQNSGYHPPFRKNMLPAFSGLMEMEVPCAYETMISEFETAR
jgi:hypothetical protein